MIPSYLLLLIGRDSPGLVGEGTAIVAGPFYVDALDLYVAGMASGEVYVSGAVAGGVYVAGAGVGQIA